MMRLFLKLWRLLFSGIQPEALPFMLLAVGVAPVQVQAQAVANPQLSVTGNVGCVGFPCQNSGTLNLSADADQTMNALQSSAQGGIKITSTATLTATRTLTVPAGTFPFHAVENATMGGQSIRLCSASGGACLTIPNSQTATGVWYDGSQFVGALPSTGSFSALTGDATSTSTGGATTVKGLNGTLLSGLGTGVLKNTTATGVPSIAASADIIALWLTGTCSSSTYLNGAGGCTTPSGSGNTTSTTLTPNTLPKANGANSIINSGVSDNGTTVTSTEPVSAPSFTSTGTTHGFSMPAGTSLSGAAGTVVYGVDGTNGYAEVNENNTGLSRICTAGNAQCASGTPAFSGITGGTNTAAAMVVGTGASLAATGSGTIAATSVPSTGVSGTLTNSQLANPSTSVNGTTCTLGSNCTVTALPPTQYIFYPAATSDGGSAFASGCSRYANNQPAAGSVNASASALGYLQFSAAVGNQYCEFTRTEPPYWTGTSISVDFFSPTTSGNVTWEIQTVCLVSGSAVLSDTFSPTFGTATPVTTSVSGTANTLLTTTALTNVAVPGFGNCPASPTTPTQVTYRIFRSASDTAAAAANLIGFNVGVSRSQ